LEEENVVDGVKYYTKNFELLNQKGEVLKCSYVSDNLFNKKKTCIVYLHGNGGNKLEGLAYTQHLIPLKVDLFTFDFSGHGNS
jgi:hypothetical protein